MVTPTPERAIVLAAKLVEVFGDVNQGFGERLAGHFGLSRAKDVEVGLEFWPDGSRDGVRARQPRLQVRRGAITPN